MAVRLRIAGATGVVVGGVLVAALAGQVPAIGVTDHAIVSTPDSAPQRLVCPGSAVAVGAEGTAADALSATGAPVRVTGTAGGAKVAVTPLKRGNVTGDGTAPRLLVAPAADGAAGAIAGAQSQQLPGGDVAGLVATSCTAPSGDAWFAAGSTTTGRTTILTLANPSRVDSRVAIRAWTEDGPADTSTTGELAVPAGARRAVSLAGIVPSAGGLVLHVTATGAPVAAALEQRTVRGLESGGADLAAPGTAPSTTQTIPGIRVSGAAAVAETRREDGYADLQPVVRVLLPGTVSADVRIQVSGSGGSASVERRVAAGVVTDFPIDGLADGAYTATVTSSRPLVAGARTSVVGDPGASTTPDDGASSGSASGSGGAAVGSDAGLVGGGAVDDSGDSGTISSSSPTSVARGIDLAWFAAAPVLGATAAVAVADAPSPQLTVANPTAAARTVQLSGGATLQVPARGTATADVGSGVLVLQDAAGLVAGVSYAGATAVAGYPVTAADQAAHPVRVTR